MPEPTTAAIRHYLTAAYSDDELTTLCFDYFRDVAANFTTGMTKARMIQLLLDHCQGHDELPSLLAALEHDRPAQFRTHFGAQAASTALGSDLLPSAAVPSARPPLVTERALGWDVFISHAWEDKEAFARPLAQALETRGLRVWFDEFTLSVGDRLRRSVDHGLTNSRYGIVILSPHFFAKEWPQKELDGLTQRENRGEKVILPVWHNITAEQIRAYSLTLADRIAVASNRGLDDVVAELLRAMGQTEKPPSPAHLEFIRIPAGEFLMGSDPVVAPQARPNEQPQHRVYLPDFSIGKYPVTNDQYAIFVQATNHPPSFHWRDGQIPAHMGNHPVIYVTHYDALAFCRWANVRLPTEAEWEKAARGPDGRLYPWGHQPPDAQRCNFNSLVNDTTPVGAYPAGATPSGLPDMAGNVWEWCSDFYAAQTYRARATSVPRDPTGPATGTLHVVRGGNWYSDAIYVRCACRGRRNPDDRFDSLGFRVARSSP